jgi:hypothetical protein
MEITNFGSDGILAMNPGVFSVRKSRRLTLAPRGKSGGLEILEFCTMPTGRSFGSWPPTESGGSSSLRVA